MDTDHRRLVEQARELAFALGTIEDRQDDVEVVAALADAVEQLQRERDDHRERGNANFDTALTWRSERDEARARVAALEAQAREIVEEIDVWEPYKSRDTGSVYLAEAVDECMAVLRALLDSGGDRT